MSNKNQHAKIDATSYVRSETVVDIDVTALNFNLTDEQMQSEYLVIRLTVHPENQRSTTKSATFLMDTVPSGSYTYSE